MCDSLPPDLWDIVKKYKDDPVEDRQRARMAFIIDDIGFIHNNPQLGVLYAEYNIKCRFSRVMTSSAYVPNVYSRTASEIAYGAGLSTLYATCHVYNILMKSRQVSPLGC